MAVAPLTPAHAQDRQPASAAFASGAKVVSLTAPDGRRIELSVWHAQRERGVVIFSHGFTGEPAAYNRIMAEWVEAGFTIVAPLHVDSLRHPERAAYDGMAVFATRLTDLAVARAYIKVNMPGKPLVAAGHSFGSLMSLIEGGAVTVAGPLGDPAVKAIVAFSSPGDAQGAVLPETYGAVRIPVLMITGDGDLVPGLVSDWQTHRRPFDRSAPGDKFLLVFGGGNHSLVSNANEVDFDLIDRMTTDFLEAYGLEDAAARSRLQSLTPHERVSLERR
jgi:dienelactone hydrolase